MPENKRIDDALYNQFKYWMKKRYPNVWQRIPSNDTKLINDVYFRSWVGETGIPLTAFGIEQTTPSPFAAEESWTASGQTPYSGITPTKTQAELDAERFANLDLEKFDWEKEQAKKREWSDLQNLTRQGTQDLWARDAAQRQGQDANVLREYLRMMSLSNDTQGQGADRAKLATEWDRMQQQYEMDRKDLVASLNQPSDWIKQWTVQNKESPYAGSNPYRKDESTIDSDIDNLQITVDRYKDSATGIAGKYGTKPEELVELLDAKVGAPTYKQPDNSEETVVRAYVNAKESLQGKETERLAIRTNLQAKYPGQPYEEHLSEEQIRPTVEKPTTAPTPSWLPKFVPTLAGKSNISKQAIETPSGQSWAATPWSQQQGLGGYAEWTGKSMNDIIGQMNVMLPQNPTLGSRWRPARQMA